MILKTPSVGSIILARRKARGMTQEDVGHKVGVTRAQVANIESGRSDMPLRTLARFAEALECQMKDLVP